MRVIDHDMIRFKATLLIAFAAVWLQSASSAPTLEWTHGRCVDCPQRYQLGDFQFLTANEGWASAFVVTVAEEHVSQYGRVVHTTDGGRTWRSVGRVETYGVDVQPTLWFINAREGWLAWPTTSEPLAHVRRTLDGGRTWRNLPSDLPGSPVHLRFFDARTGCMVVSTIDGPRFGMTTTGGSTWRFGDDPLVSRLGYPDALFFLNSKIGWLGGRRLLRTADGGASWQEGRLPADVGATFRDLFFLDADHGWAITWKENTSTLIRTDDGGRTWSETPTQPSATAGLLDAVRFLSPTAGVTFRGSLDSGGSGSPPTAEMLITSDGGVSWHTHRLPRLVQSCEIVFGEVWCSSGMDLLRIRLVS
jgi:photosystem II stability/assembly factor-like uncharacterized protein